MIECPRCGAEVEELHFLPPEVITRDLIEVIGGDADGRTHETCDACIEHLMEA